MNHRPQTQMWKKYQIPLFSSKRLNFNCGYSMLQFSELPHPYPNRSFPSTKCWESAPSPSPCPDSPASTSCESPDHTGCHGDTHPPSLPIPSGPGLLLPLHTWRLGDRGEVRKHLTLPLGVLVTPLCLGPAREQGAGSPDSQNALLLLVQGNSFIQRLF